MIGSQAQTVEMDSRIGSVGSIRQWMHVHRDAFQQASFFQRLTTTQDGVAEDRVVLLEKAKGEG